MPQNVTLYTLLISCPGDVKEEISIIQSAVDEFNELYAEPLGITIQTKYWGKSSFAQSGGKPQALLNEQFVNKCDAAVAIFWTKFGSPTDGYGSGTEEEIEIMLQSGKQVFMYFSDKSIPPSQMNEDGYKKVQAFRERYKDRGIYFTYSSDDEFKKLFFAHLSMYFLSDKKIKDTETEKRSKLKLLGIDQNGKLADEASIYSFVLNTETTTQHYIDTICSMFQEIVRIKVCRRQPTNNNPFSSFNFLTPVDIDDDERKLITSIAGHLDLELPDGFFDLGDLSKDPLTSNVFSGPKLKGTPDEMKKYRKIKKLHETISEVLEWAPVEKAFSNMHCFRLAVQNSGKGIDEDVEITFEIPQNALLTLNEFPQFENSEMGYLLNDCEMGILFGIDSTAEYMEYSESNRSGNIPYNPRPYGSLGYVPKYNDDFIAELNSVFCYSIYENGDNYILKLKVDYIKHNTTVAFPTIIFVKGEVDEIPYKITSQNNPDIVEGVLKIKKSENEPTAV